MWNVLVAVGLAVLVPTLAAAQVVVGPSTALFSHSDEQYAITATYHFDFYQCASVTVDATNPQGVCVGKAASPFQAGADVAKASVAGSAANRSVNLRTVATTNGVLMAMPIGVGFVTAVTAIADTTIPGVAGSSPPSTDSNPFFGQARTPAAPGNARIQ